MATPDNVATALKELKNHLEFLAAGGSMPTVRRRQRASKALDNLKVVSDYVATVDRSPQAAARSEANVREPADVEGSKRIEDFLQTVGRGARKAQEQLDALSADYIVKRPPFAPETMFRIPKVSANLKLGMRETESREIDFFVIARESEDTKFLEQEISFEIVAAPPPPDALEGLSELPIGSILVTNAVERSRISARLEEEKAREAELDDQATVDVVDQMLAPGALRRVLALRGEAAWTLLLIAAPKDRVPGKPQEAVAMLRLPFEKQLGRPRSFAPGRHAERVKLFYRLLFPVADRQAELLTEFGRT